MDAIAQWLKNPYDYQKGVTLLREHGGSRVLLMMLETGESSFNKKKLIESLENIQNDRSPTVGSTVSKPTQTSSAIVDVPFQKIKQSVSVKLESKLEDDLKLLYTKQSAAHTRLKMMHDLAYDQKEKRAKCFEILDIGKEIRAIHLVIRDMEKTGKVPKHLLELEELDPASQYKKLTNNRAYISKFSEDPEKEGEVERRITENYKLEKLLNVNQN